MSDEQAHSRGYRVTGRVQGVGFRWWTQRVARELGLVGSVCNRPDGSVELVAAGGSEAVGELERRLKDGPSSARVDSVEMVESSLPADDDDFVITRGW